MTDDEICALSASQAAVAISQLSDTDASRITIKYLRRSRFPPTEMLALIQKKTREPLSYRNEVLEQLKQPDPSEIGAPVASTIPLSAATSGWSAMTGWGAILAGLSVLLGFWAAIFDVSVASGSTDYPSRVVNTGLLADRALLAICSATLFLAGIVLMAAGQIEKAIRTKKG